MIYTNSTNHMILQWNLKNRPFKLWLKQDADLCLAMKSSMLNIWDLVILKIQFPAENIYSNISLHSFMILTFIRPYLWQTNFGENRPPPPPNLASIRPLPNSAL